MASSKRVHRLSQQTAKLGTSLIPAPPSLGWGSFSFTSPSLRRVLKRKAATTMNGQPYRRMAREAGALCAERSFYETTIPVRQGRTGDVRVSATSRSRYCFNQLSPSLRPSAHLHDKQIPRYPDINGYGALVYHPQRLHRHTNNQRRYHRNQPWREQILEGGAVQLMISLAVSRMVCSETLQRGLLEFPS